MNIKVLPNQPATTKEGFVANGSGYEFVPAECFDPEAHNVRRRFPMRDVHGNLSACGGKAEVIRHERLGLLHVRYASDGTISHLWIHGSLSRARDAARVIRFEAAR